MIPRYATVIKHSPEGTEYPHHNETKALLSSHGALMRHNIGQVVSRTKMSFSVFCFSNILI